MYTKHEMTVLIEEKLKKAFKGKNECKQDLYTFEKWMFQNPKITGSPLTTVIYLVKVETAEA